MQGLLRQGRWHCFGNMVLTAMPLRMQHENNGTLQMRPIVQQVCFHDAKFILSCIMDKTQELSVSLASSMSL